MRRYGFRDSFVGLVLLFFGWESRAVEVEKLGPIKADAFRAVARNRIDVLRQFDVRGKDDVTAVSCGGSRFAQAGELLGHLPLTMFKLAVMPQCLRRRSDDEQTVVPV